MTETKDLELAGDTDAQQVDPEESFDINEQYPAVDPTDVVAMAAAVQHGTPIVALAEAHEATQLTTHTWTPGAECPMRSHNRKVGSLVGVYSLDHPQATHHAPADLADVHWLARCETHNSNFYSKAFGPAWKARNKPWVFCPECQAIFDAKNGGGKAVVKGKKAKGQASVAVAPKPEPKPKKPKVAKVETTEVEHFETTEDLQAAGIPGTITPAAETLSPAEDAQEYDTWMKWSGTLAAQIPSGAKVVWIGPYHYSVDLADGRQIECRVHKGDIVLRFRNASGHDTYEENLPALLAKIG